ncbi:MAG: Hsp20/alpha crystallin family protein [Firmicutes bacterium]|nr:Hsp20/alpha crystallin family protein [Alicyclobacillaceae bacterium]MCL6497105.1 Hsp20/alpha crystallin family protein [Bacillota bacterium]
MSLVPMVRNWDVWGDDGIGSLTEWVDRLFDRPLLTEWPWPTSVSLPAVDVVDAGDRYEVRVEVPGVAKDDLEVLVDGDTLVIRGEKRQEAAQEGTRYHWSERRVGRFLRRIGLPAGIRADGVTASLKDGILTVTVPKPEGSGKRIEIQAG